MYKEVAQKIMYAFRQHGKLYPLANLSDEIEEILKRYFPEQKVYTDTETYLKEAFDPKPFNPMDKPIIK